MPGSPPLARERRIIPIRRDPVSGITPARAGKTIIQGEMTLFDRDHPRSRGKDFKVFSPSSDELGSPPLARERRIYYSGAWKGGGITPARAGKTLYCTLVPTAYEDHPRSRGKDSRPRCWCRPRMGSPPLARERLRPRPIAPVVVGITPARAGKTSPASSQRPRSWDHPRSRGKDTF